LRGGLHFSASKIEGVLSSDAFSTFAPRGTTSHTRLGKPRYAKESKQILERIDHELSLKVGGITADPKFSSGMDR
jgi:hypothetical protein